jgi:uncharacterized repeat protein (TIGR01451 family)
VVPSWSTFTLPGGGQVSITFTVNVAATVAPGSYQNATNALYLDPGRTTANGTTASRYNYLASNGEDVTIQAADLTLQKRHSGSFQEGAQGVYTLAVRNIGNAASAGVVTVRDTLPAPADVRGRQRGVDDHAERPDRHRHACRRDRGRRQRDVHAHRERARGRIPVGHELGDGVGRQRGHHDQRSRHRHDQRERAARRDGRQAPHRGVRRGANRQLHARRHQRGPRGDGLGGGRRHAAAGLSFNGGAGAGWTFVQNAAVITATHAGPIAAGDSATFTLSAAVASAAFPSVTNAAVATTATDPNPANNRDVDPTTVAGVPNITMDLRHTSGFTVGVNGIYFITLRNTGTAATSSTITVTDTLPTGLSFAGLLGFGWAFSTNGNALTATYAGSIAPGDSARFRLTVAVGQAAYPERDEHRDGRDER